MTRAERRILYKMANGDVAGFPALKHWACELIRKPETSNEHIGFVPMSTISKLVKSKWVLWSHAEPSGWRITEAGKQALVANPTEPHTAE